VTFEGDRGKARTTGVGPVQVERASVRALLLGLPHDEAAANRLIDDAVSKSTTSKFDQVLLRNGDVLSGTVVRIGEPKAGGGSEITIDGDGGRFELPLQRCRAVVLASEEDKASAAEKQLQEGILVGLDDGSRILAVAVRSTGGGHALQGTCAGEVTLTSGRSIVALQKLGGSVCYLSDLPPASYRHEPYLSLPWDYRGDRNVLGQPLRVGGRTYLKGIGMHSAARLTFDLDGRHRRFAASAAIDDAADRRGSVTFRVFLRVEDQWEEAFTSGAVRGGDLPQVVAVELGKATQLSLVVDYADRGDERDYANWLDARLERTETD
jgi:hypothetical protein